MTLGAKRSGEALRASAGDLVRVWRATRYTSGAQVFPGLLDAVMEEFLERAAEALLLELPRGEAWSSTRGIVRLPARDESAEALGEEWRLAREVLMAACEALEVCSEAVEAVQIEIDRAVAGIEPLLAGVAPAGVLVIRQLAGFRRRGESRNGGPR